MSSQGLPFLALLLFVIVVEVSPASSRGDQCGGDFELPRLRRKPSVNSLKPESAGVSFYQWNRTVDLGMPPPGSRLSYLLRLWEDKEGKRPKDFEASNVCHLNIFSWKPTACTLTGLMPGTRYRVRALVKVEVGGQTCITDEAEETIIETPCPVPPVPEGLSVFSISSNSFEAQLMNIRYPQQCDLHYIVAVYDTRNDSEPIYFEQSNMTEEHHLVDGLQPNTQYIVEIYIAYKGGGYIRTNNTTVRTAPSEAGKVTHLQVKLNVTSVLVTWDDPADNLPRGELESFRVTWGTEILGSEQKQQDIGRHNSFTIEDLSPNTTYIIKVEAKYRHMDMYGAASSITTTTTVGVPSRVEDLKTTNATESSLIISWRNSRKLTGIITFYNVSLRPVASAIPTAAANPQWNTTINITQAEFYGLGAGREYVTRVAACNWERCGDAVEESVWTCPDPPRTQENAAVAEATETTVTIQLPLLANPPGWHYVTLQRDGTGLLTTDEDQALMDAALALVASEEERNDVDFSHSTNLDSDSAYIAAKVEQEGNERLQVTLGDDTTFENRYKNHPLKNGAAYLAVVVTEKRNGPLVKRWANPPLRFVVTPTVHKGEVLGLLTGMAVVVLVVSMVLIVCLKKNRKRVAAKKETVHRRKDTTVRYSKTEHINHPDQANQAPAVFLPSTVEKTAILSNAEPIYLPLELLADYPGQASQNPPKEEIYANATLLVPKKDLEAYLLRAVISTETEEEFAGIPPFFCLSTSVCDLPVNRTKNRHNDKVTYDETRVILPLYANIPHTDYINANFIEGPGRGAAFIATQGPTHETVGAFWRMMWHTQCPTIVMVANTVERGKEMVAQYWPETEPMVAEGVTVTPEGVTKTMAFVVRTFSLSVGSAGTQVTQYQYTAWPDHGVPHMAYDMANMLKMVRRNHGGRLPITVHCSAGIGRAGVVVLVLYLLEELEARGTVSIVRALLILVRCRGRLVENVEQYVFAHQVLHEILFSLDTAFPCHSFGEQLASFRSPQAPEGVSPLQQQFKKLKSLPIDISFNYGKDPACAHLNRNQDILPADSRLIFVPGPGCRRDARYLNVVRINGADKKDAYIAGEHPQTHTLAKMWQLVLERQVGVWVLVHSFPPNDQKYPCVVCESSMLQANMTLTASETRSLEHYDEQEVNVCGPAMGGVSMHRCVLLTLKGWPADHSLPPSPEPLLSLVERATAISGNRQTLITCRDGVTGCGVVAALLVALRRTRLTQEVDIYRAVASVTHERPQFIVDQDQYEFLHLGLETFLSREKH